MTNAVTFSFNATETKQTKQTASPRRSRRRTDLPDTTTVTIRNATDRELLAPIFDADPNRSTHYLPPKLKGRILR